MVIPSFRPLVGGAERQLEGLAGHLSRQGAESFVLTRRVAGSLRKEPGEGYMIERLPCGIPKVGFGISVFFSLLARSRSIDVIHCHTLSAQTALACVAAGRLSGTPVIVKVTRSGPQTQLRRYLRNRTGRRLFKGLMAGAARVIAITAEVKEELLLAGVAAGKIAEIPNGVELADRAAVKPAGGVQFVFTGRLIGRKRVDMLIRAFADLNLAGEARLTIAGDGPDRQELEQLAARLGAGSSIRFAGKLDQKEVLRLLSGADVFILPSASEGMSNALLEAMAMGLPAVAADIPANRSIIQDRVNGFLFRGETELGGLLQELAADPGLREKAGKRARNKIEEQFCFASIASKYSRLYNELSNDL